VKQKHGSETTYLKIVSEVLELIRSPQQVMILMMEGGNGGIAQVHVDDGVQASEQVHLSLVPLPPISLLPLLFP